MAQVLSPSFFCGVLGYFLPFLFFVVELVGHTTGALQVYNRSQAGVCRKCRLLRQKQGWEALPRRSRRRLVSTSGTTFPNGPNLLALIFFSLLFWGRMQGKPPKKQGFPRGPKSWKKINLAWTLEHFKFSLEIFNLAWRFQNLAWNFQSWPWEFPTKNRVWWVARLKCSISLENVIRFNLAWKFQSRRAILKIFKIWALWVFFPGEPPKSLWKKEKTLSSVFTTPPKFTTPQTLLGEGKCLQFPGKWCPHNARRDSKSPNSRCALHSLATP